MVMTKNARHQFELLRKKRLELGLSQSALAKKINVSQQHMDRYEKGHPLPLDKVLLLSNILNISKWDLLPPEFTPENTHYFNKTLLIEIIISVERLIIEKKLNFAPNDKARLIALLYERLVKNPSNDNIQQNIRTLLVNFMLEKSA